MGAWAEHLLPCRSPYAGRQRPGDLSQAMQRLPQQCLALEAARWASVPAGADLPYDGLKAARQRTVPLSAGVAPSIAPSVTHAAHLH